jgi:hypothetical protein
MDGGRIAQAQAVRGLFWTMALLLGALWYIPADLPPPPLPRASSSFVLPSRCVPTLCHGQMMLLLRYHLFVTIFTCVFLTMKTKALLLSAGDDDLPKPGGVKATSTTLLRAMLFLDIAASVVGAALSAAALVTLLEVKLGVLLACMSTAFQGAIYGALVLFVGAVCYPCVGLVKVAMLL